MLTVHVVSHTHWDREWYHPAERFRQGLAMLVDELLDQPPAAGRGFLLDGQSVVLEDYLEVRPERASELAALLRDGRLEAGPWYVLPDELIPGAEGLVRNLLAGARTLRAMRASAPPVLYCPDSFGHPAALPELARGFGRTLVVLWRGMGGARWPDSNLVRWRAPSGADVLVYHLTRSGYELGSTLPVEAAQARARWARIRAEFAERRQAAPELLLNGADHHARQRSLDDAIAALARAAVPAVVKPDTLSGFAGAVGSLVDADLPEIAGELRDSYGYAWTLQGTLASRAPQKRRYAAAEREMVRDVEPWAALARLRGGVSRRHLARAAWKPLLLCQPHDTLCGCSVDQVARAMDARLDSAATQAEGLRESATFDLVGHDREAARHWTEDWQPVVLIRNPAPRRRSGVAVAGISVKLADVPVGPGSAPRQPGAARPDIAFDASVVHERTESPRAYPDNDAVLKFHAAMWVEDAPPYGVVSVPLDGQMGTSPPEAVAVQATARSLSNGRLRVSWDRRGQVTLEDLAARRAIRGVFAWESRADAGDLYTPSIREGKLRARLVSTALLEKGPAIGIVEQLWRLKSREGHVEARLRIVLEAGVSFLRFGVLGDNAARDHRLRLAVRTDVAGARTWADAAFGTVERRPVKVPRAAARMEHPVPTAPLHRHVSLFGGRRGATLYADGATEYESRDGAILVTLVRAVGELSRNDLPERPGHAGWPVPTPEAQCIGVFQGEFALLLHGPRSPTVIDEIERTADDVLYPLTGETLRSALAVPAPVGGVELSGRGLAFSAFKESEDGEWIVLRCVNLLDQPVAGAWHLAIAVEEARMSRLDETPLDVIPLRGDAVPFTAAPRAVVTILVR